jgi:hypothetical protein
MWEILAFGTFWFWAILGIEFLVLLICANMDGKIGTSILTLIGTMLAINYLGTPFLGYVFHNPFMIVAWGVVYLVVGSAWSIFKWWRYVMEQRERYDELREGFLKKYIDAPGRTQKEEWKRLLDTYDVDVRPEAGSYRNKPRICNWIMYWPWSLLWALINDPVRWAGRRIHKAISSAMQKISDIGFKGTEGDL